MADIDDDTLVQILTAYPTFWEDLTEAQRGKGTPSEPFFGATGSGPCVLVPVFANTTLNHVREVVWPIVEVYQRALRAHEKVAGTDSFVDWVDRLRREGSVLEKICARARLSPRLRPYVHEAIRAYQAERRGKLDPVDYKWWEWMEMPSPRTMLTWKEIGALCKLSRSRIQSLYRKRVKESSKSQESDTKNRCNAPQLPVR